MQKIGYTRSDYFRQYLDKFEGNYNYKISSKDLNLIKKVIKNQYENDITYENIKSVLKQCQLYKYYEDIPKIYEILSGKEFPKISKKDRERLLESINKFSSGWGTNILNFLNVNFVIEKEAKKLNIQLPPMNHKYKDPEKQEIIWKKINWNVKYGETCKILEQHLLNILLKRNYATIILQTSMRQMVAKRYLQRLKIGRELEYYPNIGIKYFEALADFNNLI